MSDHTVIECTELRARVAKLERKLGNAKKAIAGLTELRARVAELERKLGNAKKAIAGLTDKYTAETKLNGETRAELKERCFAHAVSQSMYDAMLGIANATLREIDPDVGEADGPDLPIMAADLRKHRDELHDTLSRLSSYVGSGLGDDSTSAAEFDSRIRDGIDHMMRAERSRGLRPVFDVFESWARRKYFKMVLEKDALFQQRVEFQIERSKLRAQVHRLRVELLDRAKAHDAIVAAARDVVPFIEDMNNWVPDMAEEEDHWMMESIKRHSVRLRRALDLSAPTSMDTSTCDVCGITSYSTDGWVVGDVTLCPNCETERGTRESKV